MFKYASRLSRHYFEKTRVRDLLVEHVVNRHLAQILKVFFVFGFEADRSR